MFKELLKLPNGLMHDWNLNNKQIIAGYSKQRLYKMRYLLIHPKHRGSLRPAEGRQLAFFPKYSKCSKISCLRGAAIAQWICLRLAYCCPGFKSQANHLHFYQFIFELCRVEKTKINKKEAGLAHLKTIFIT